MTSAELSDGNLQAPCPPSMASFLRFFSFTRCTLAQARTRVRGRISTRIPGQPAFWGTWDVQVAGRIEKSRKLIQVDLQRRDSQLTPSYQKPERQIPAAAGFLGTLPKAERATRRIADWRTSSSHLVSAPCSERSAQTSPSRV